MQKDVFISHSRTDKDLAGRVCGFLEKRGVSCWIAPRDVTPGAVFDEAIIEAIDCAQAMVLILSGQANASAFVKGEVNRAFSKGKTIFAFRVEDIAPSGSLELYLARHQWTDGFSEPLDEKLEHLAAAILALLRRAPERVEIAPRRTEEERDLSDAVRMLVFYARVTYEANAYLTLGSLGIGVVLGYAFWSLAIGAAGFVAAGMVSGAGQLLARALWSRSILKRLRALELSRREIDEIGARLKDYPWTNQRAEHAARALLVDL